MAENKRGVCIHRHPWVALQSELSSIAQIEKEGEEARMLPLHGNHADAAVEKVGKAASTPTARLPA